MLKDFIGNVKRLLRGERGRRPPIVRPTCYACRQEIDGPGYRWGNRLYCDVYCVPPFVVAGDPR